MKRPDGIDIIIPIYNAFEDLQKCIASILECTDLQKHRLLLVNDASPDDRILPYIKSFESDRILVVENEKNLGFSGSINHGITESKTRDVLLLNSDTIVTRNWVEKIVDCAYSDPSIATVTPLSNNATLCSVPEFLEENTLPDGYSLEQYSDLIETVSMRLYPRIPVANGFCMFIKREVIEKIGLFDMETFERGYGEENDFCYRAEQIGYHHAMCDDTYIYHTGTTSFISDEKKKYIEAHEKVLNERYPEQNHGVAVHCRDNPNEQIQENIKLWTGLLNGKKNLLYLVQSDFREDAHDHLGGTQLHVKDMVASMRDSYNIFVAARNIDYLNFTAYTKDDEFTFKFYIGKATHYPEFRNRKFAEIYGKILDVFCIDLVHIHHTKDLTLELYYQASARKIPIVVTLHDYYTVCPKITMVNEERELCIGIDNASMCQKCMECTKDISANTDYVKIWRREHERVLQLADIIIVPSESAKNVITSYYHIDHTPVISIEHGMSSELKSELYPSPNGEFHVAFIGGINYEKGGENAFNLIKSSSDKLHWFLFGAWGYNNLSMLEKKNYTKTGLYERDTLPELMQKYQIDLICILPVLSETYCYTLSEAVLCGIPVIATDIGALGERMKALDCGWLVSGNNVVEDTLSIIQRIKDKGAEYQEKVQHIRELEIKNLNNMKAEYLSLYRRFFESTLHHTFSGKNVPWVLDGYLLANGKRTYSSADGSDLVEQFEKLNIEYKAITNSFTYKCVRALGELRVPGKKYIKKILYHAYKIAKKS